MLTGSRRMSHPGDQDTFYVLALEVGGATFYFGDVSKDITNDFGTAAGQPTVLHVHGTNLVDSFSKGFDIATDTSTDSSVSIADLRLPIALPALYAAGETLAGNRAELSILKVGEDYGQRWTVVAGIVENPVLMSPEAVENTVSFTIDPEGGLAYDFPSNDYKVSSGWLSDDDTVSTGSTPAEAFGLDEDYLTAGGIDWADENFLFSNEDIVLTMPTDYADAPAFVPFVFGKPGFTSDSTLYKDVDGNGSITLADDVAVATDDRIRYFTTPGQTVAVLTLGATTITDPDTESSDGGTKLVDIIDELDIIADLGDGADLDVSVLIDGAEGYVFEHADVALWVRVAIHAGKAAQVGTAIDMMDRVHFGTPYSCTGSYTPALGRTNAGKLYTYVDIKADYSGFLALMNPGQRFEIDSGHGEIYIRDRGDGDWGFVILGREVSPVTSEDADALWWYAYCCWLGALRSGGNTGDMLDAFFANPEIQRLIEDKDAGSDSDNTYQDYHLSCFNTAMDPDNRFVIQYPTADQLDAHCPGAWSEGGQAYLDGAAIENPAELVMCLCDDAGLAYDRGSLFALRDRFRNWKIAGHIDEQTDVLAYVTGAMQTYLPFTVGRSAEGITATFWDWSADKTQAAHHFVEGVDFEAVGEGLVVDEAGMVRSLRLSARPVTWLHQENQPYATTTELDTGQLTAEELSRLDRLKSGQPARASRSPGVATGEPGRPYFKYLRQLRSKYGSWDFSQSSSITEQTDFWRVNNYTGDTQAADRGEWTENALTFPILSKSRELWSRYLPSPLLVAAFQRWAYLDRTDLPIELEDVSDLETMQRVADWILAARSQPTRTFQGISGKRRGWLVEGDVVRVTAPSLGLTDQVCLVAEKGWQSTNCLFTFRPIGLPARDTRVPTLALSTG